MPVDEVTRILVVADWTVEASDVVAECRRRAEHRPVRFVVTVPAWLHGLDWAGDPRASVPCARRQLATLAQLFVEAGLVVEVAGVGDPDPISAIGDALDDHPAAQMLLFVRRRHVPAHPLDLVHRAHRRTGLPVQSVAVRAASRDGHCRAEQALAA